MSGSASSQHDLPLVKIASSSHLVKKSVGPRNKDPFHHLELVERASAQIPVTSLESLMKLRIIRGIFTSDKRGSSDHHCDSIAQISGCSLSS
ncbi:hypothetical protein TNCV_4321091 [Trichonephila clavipes]|uniref:Uncharacterized protein n=1 Tax=Trichonephila clavipes TaxID=2585209 RepID=A0A8X6SDL6_TRICX|nr:hypothetical protein TNCV_4321091 [Trichonephila clavipes]